MKTKLIQKTLLSLLITGSTVMFSSCGGVSLLPTGLSIYNGQEEITSLVMFTDEAIKLSAVISPEKADQNVTWSSNNTSIVTVSDSGEVKGLTAGETTIKVTSVKNSNLHKDITVKVNSRVLPESIKINKSGQEISTLDTYIKDTNQLEAVISPTGASQEVTWTSDKPNIASVSETGLVTSESEGTATITVTSKVLSTLSKSITVKVNKEKPSDSDYYLIGTGNFQKGGNYTFNGGYQLTEDIDYDGSYDHHYYIEDAEFTIGDSFKIKNRATNYIVNSYSTNNGSFTTNNVSLDKSYEDEYKIDICKTGKYTVDLYQTGSTYTCSITNGTGTTANSLKPYTGTAQVEFLSFGDFHGNVEDLATNKPGIARYVTAVKNTQNKYASQTPVLINNGDMWQGSYYSNNNYGSLLNDTMTEMKADAFCLGNHEFDWGQTKIANNQAKVSFPYLGANIEYYKNSKVGKLVDYVQPYTIVERQNIRIGIIGLIGADQITSITSSNVDDITFSNDVTAIKKYSDKLRKTFGCEMIVVSDHAGTDDGKTILNEVATTSSVSGKRYVDMMIFGHDHSPTKGIVNEVPYVNSGSNGTALSWVSLKYDNGTVTMPSEKYYGNTSVTTSTSEDANTKKIIDNYITPEIIERASSVAGTIDNDFSSSAPSGEAPRMMAKAMFEYAQSKGHNVALAIVNQSRAALSAGQVPFTDLFTAFPFSNKTIIMKAKGKDIKKEAKYNAYYSNNTSQTFSDDSEYLIATYDYLAFHQNESREYDYFKNGFTVVKEYSEIAPVDMIYNYMQKQTGTIKQTDYQTSNFTFLS